MADTVETVDASSDSAIAADRQRLLTEYAERQLRYANSNTYSLRNSGHLFMVQTRQRAVLDMLSREAFGSFDDKDILEIGCANGRILHDFLSFGADPTRLHGVELRNDALQEAIRLNPGLQWTNADAQQLPFPAERFDLVMQFTVFTSILDDAIKRSVASEMLRVVRPGGLILWYDFWWNPKNKQTRGVGFREIRSLFPDCDYTLRRITLAPPISRFLARYSWLGCQFLDRLRFLSSHYLVAIRPQSLHRD